MGEINPVYGEPAHEGKIIQETGLKQHLEPGGNEADLLDVRGSTISFHDINYNVEISKACCCRKTDKQILLNVSGLFRPGMNAIMGPTGSGKTTLLDVLAGRSETAGISGRILVDGRLPPKNYKCMTGYVVQDDVVMGTLTVRENLMFSANLRLPEKMTSAERERLVDDAIRELGLSKCANTKVGTEFIRGVSGGERKRTNIGMELIISPPVLFLDEPTTGLDSNTANSVMALLHRLSRRGCTIIFSIHQPRFSIYKLFDRLSLLAAGQTIYHGEASEALEFFQNAGYECEEHNNPPDFFLDVINSDASNLMVDSRPEAAFSASGVGLHLNDVELQPEEDKQQTNVTSELVSKFLSSRWFQRMHDDIDPILAGFSEASSGQKHSSKTVQLPASPQYATSFTTQMRHVSKRAFLNFLRNPQATIMQNAVSIFFSVVLGLIFLQLDLNKAGLQGRYGAMFFLTVNQLFTNLPAIEIFMTERAIFVHESASGFYRVSTYFLSKILFDLLPMRVIPLTFFTIIIYFMIGFQVHAGKFFIFYLTFTLTTLAASAIAFFFGATVRTYTVANLACVLVYIISMIFGGLLVNLEDMGDWLNWLQYLSIVRFSLNALSITELKGLKFTETLEGGITYNVTGTQFLEEQGIHYKSDWDLWHNMMAIAIIGIGVEVLAYVQLRRMKKLK